MFLFKGVIKILFLELIFSFLLIAQSDKQISEIISTTQSKFVPDKRLGVYKIEYTIDKDKVILSGESDNKDAIELLLYEISKVKDVKIENKINLLPDNTLGENMFGLIHISVANMRKEPDHSAELVSQALLGTEIKLLKKKSGYYLCQTPEGYLGWIQSSSIITQKRDLLEEWRKTKKVIYLDLFGIIYSEPSEESDPICDIVLNCVVKYESIDGNWMKVITPKGAVGYIKEKSAMDFDLWSKTRIATPESIIKTAKRFLGFPYLWGGYSAKGLDCSGFAKTVFWTNGIMLSRDASQQALFGEEIQPGKNFESVKTGDLLFFGSKGKDARPRITHVGIYLGDKNFIHSSSGFSSVQISSFEKDSKKYEYYDSDRLLKIMRVLK